MTPSTLRRRKDAHDYAWHLQAARDAGPTRSCCATHGGSLPHEIAASRRGLARFGDCVASMRTTTPTWRRQLLEAVRAGAGHVQGTLNGFGERTGNANLCSILPN